ncbi:hypothetical protein PIGHUM_02425 [Pigmentiphaga humi]|uniref:Uncharacterized protein n=1 Tax=Pigmentiphaga humi TaxID=2478468 RepID=A0A3P4B242_9BURK|nr:hypothetical protein [Pigmentiphaga humi]VCU70353.1 hypothetical protein PIGHUM_02425 [Pigmentiphaga humi]
MRIMLAACAIAVAAECAAQVPAGAGEAMREDECATNRDVGLIVVRLREQGWTAQRTVETVLTSARMNDPETRKWFIDLVAGVHRRHATPDDLEADYGVCMKENAIPAPGRAPVRQEEAVRG